MKRWFANNLFGEALEGRGGPSEPLETKLDLLGRGGLDCIRDFPVQRAELQRQAGFEATCGSKTVSPSAPPSSTYQMFSVSARRGLLPITSARLGDALPCAAIDLENSNVINNTMGWYPQVSWLQDAVTLTNGSLWLSPPSRKPWTKGIAPVVVFENCDATPHANF